MIGRAVTAAAVAMTLVVSGCGGDDDDSEPKEPKLPSDLATALAIESDRIAESLAAGQGCTARRQAQALRAHVGDAVASGEVPPALGREMSAGASALSDGISCEPAPQPVEQPEPAPTGCEAIVAQMEQLRLQTEQQAEGPLAHELRKQLDEQVKALEEQFKEQCEGGDDDDEEEGGPDFGDGSGPGGGGPPGLGGESPGNSEHSGGGRLEGD